MGCPSFPNWATKGHTGWVHTQHSVVFLQKHLWVSRVQGLNSRGQSNRTAERAFASYAANLGSTLRTPYGALSPGMIPELRARVHRLDIPEPTSE